MDATTTHPVTHRGYKFRLDPRDNQLQTLAQAAGAARVAYNMLTEHNTRALRAGWALQEQLTNAGLSTADAKAAVVKQRKTDPRLKTLGYQQFDTQHLGPRITAHRAAAEAIAHGADPDEAWAGQRWAQPWFHTVSRKVMVSGLQNANKAFTNWMASLTGARAGARVGLPRFKKKGRDRDSFTIPAGGTSAIGTHGTPYKRGEARAGQVISDYRHLRLGFLGTIRTHQNTRQLLRAVNRGGMIKSFTISRDATYWYASLLVESPAPDTPPTPTKTAQANGAVGVDWGVHSLAALSTGQLIPNPQPVRTNAARLKKLQQKLARTQKGSTRRANLVARIGRLQHTIALQRATAIHRLSKHLATGFAQVAIEDLNVAGMTRTARGSIETPGKNVRAKSGLNRAVLDAAPGMLRRQLEYKTSWYGARLTIIDRFAPSSKTCSNCGARKSNLPLSERVYRCTQCGQETDRDVNAAINIRALALGGVMGRALDLAPGAGESLNGRGAPVPSDRSRSDSTGPGHRSVKTTPPPGGGSPYPSNRVLIPHNAWHGPVWIRGDTAVFLLVV